MNFGVLALTGLALLIDVGCWIYVLVQIFQREGVGRGLLGIVCGVYAFHYGWRNASGWDLIRAEKDKPPVFKKMMLVWTLALIVLIIVPRVAGA